MIEIDGNLRRQFTAALPDKAPSFFFLDIPSADAERFDGFVRAQAPRRKLERVPMLRGRIVAANGIKAEDLKPRRTIAPGCCRATAASPMRRRAGRLARRRRRMVGRRTMPGRRWSRSRSKIADGLGLKLGDTITVNVLGRNITARIANLREVDWQSLGINFVMVFSPGTFRGAPHTRHRHADLSPTAARRRRKRRCIKALADDFPGGHRGAGQGRARRRRTVSSATWCSALRGASAVTLIAAALVLGGALAAGHRIRVYDAVVLKTLGATRRRLIAAYALEYLLLGLATALVRRGRRVAGRLACRDPSHGIAASSSCRAPAAGAAGRRARWSRSCSGLLGTFSALGHKPAPVLRNL